MITKIRNIVERNIVEEGLELGLTISEMKFACPLLCKCVFETQNRDRADLRQTYCHNAKNYLKCVAYKTGEDTQ